MLWIDVGDPANNAEVFYDIREHARLDGLDYAIEWDAKDGTRACGINAEPIDDCGWAKPSKERAARLPIAVARCATLKAAREPHIAAAYDRAITRQPS
ncbi:MAG: hypothetical protein ACFCVK_19630 [Acidimicrobiales bacterium]